MEDTQLTTGGGRVKMGRTYDIECDRTSYRLQGAVGILGAMGIKAVWPDHDDNCPKSDIYRKHRPCSPICPVRRAEIYGPHWPEWATNRMFNLAYDLACEVQAERGGWHRAEASRLHDKQHAALRS